MYTNNGKKIKVVYITGTRSEYGLMRTTLKAIERHASLKLGLIVTGMHFSKRFGNSYKEILEDGFKISRVKIPEVTDELTMLRSLGFGIVKLSKALHDSKPDIVLVEGDRYEALTGAISGAFLNVPVAHVSGGDVSGSIDESIRHSITKFSHIHFPGTKKSAQRLIKMGENPKYIFEVGTPGIEKSHVTSKELSKKFKIDVKKPVIVVIQHPVTNEAQRAGKQMRETMLAVSKLGQQTVVVYPNTDPGSRAMIREIEKYRPNKNIRIYKNIPRDYFLGLMSVASVMIGNSSAGITEAPVFHLPVINIGGRQKGRERANNIVDISSYNHRKIINAAQKILNKKSKRKVVTPYAGKKTAEKIANTLAKVKITEKLVQKQLTY